MERATVLVADERIAAIGPQSDVAIPDGCEIHDISGATVTPGFIDAHVHIGFVDPADVLRRGVTTVRDLGWPPEEIHRLAARSRSVDFDGPEILAAGPILTAPGGYPTRAAWAPQGTGRVVGGASEARSVVAQTVEEGASVIKIALNPPVGPTFDRETLTAVVVAASDAGLRVTGHIHGLEELANALEAGVHELAHMLMGDEEIPSAVVRRMVDHGMVVVPTLSIRTNDGFATAKRNLTNFKEAGGKVVYGTDLGNEGPEPGIDRLEVEAMSSAGFSVTEITRSATVDAAAWLGLPDRGCLKEGLLADLVVFQSSLDDAVDLSTKVAKVWRRGLLRAG